MSNKQGKSWDSAYEWQTVTLLTIGFGLVGLDRMIIAPLFPVMMKDLNLNYQDLGYISAVLAITWGIFSILMGGLSDKFGRRKVLVVATVMFSLFAGLSGLAIGLTSLLIFRAVMGAFEGAFTPTAIAATQEASKVSRRGFNMGLQQSMFPLLGLGFGPILATQLLNVVPSWHWVFVIVSVPGLVIAFLLNKVIREPEHISQAAEKRPWVEIFRYRNVTLATVSIFGVMSCVFVIGAMMPNYLTDYLKLTIGEMGFIVSAIGFGGFLGEMVVPALSDRFGRKAAIIGSFICSIGLLILFMNIGPEPILLFTLLFLVALFTFGSLCLLAGPITTESVHPALIASAVSIPIGVGEIFGGGVMPAIAGYVAQNYGIEKILYIPLIGLGLCIIVSCFIRETAPIKVGKIQNKLCEETVSM